SSTCNPVLTPALLHFLTSHGPASGGSSGTAPIMIARGVMGCRKFRFVNHDESGTSSTWFVSAASLGEFAILRMFLGKSKKCFAGPMIIGEAISSILPTLRSFGSGMFAWSSTLQTGASVDKINDRSTEAICTQIVSARRVPL